VKVSSTTVSGSEISSLIDFEMPDVSPETQAKVGDFLVEQILQTVSGARSPISGESWKRTLSPMYAKEKNAEGLTAIANLESSGSMLDSLSWRATDKGIEIGIFNEEAEKADGHNNFSGDSTLPQRRFLPDIGQEFKSAIQKEAEKIISDELIASADLSKSTLRDIESKAELYDYLKTVFGDLTRPQIRDAISANSDLLALLEDTGADEFL
jgi:nitrogenase molybdenum-iron protein alpha/beta subunit